MRDKKIGKNNPNYGKHHTEEAKKRISDANSVRIYCVEEDRFYNSIREAAKAHGCVPSNIKNVLCGRSKTACGSHWVYASDVEKLQDENLQNVS